MAAEKLFEVWVKRNPKFEIDYEKGVIKKFTDYGVGANSYQESRGKIFGAGYEIYIVAFFIGLYFNRRKVLNLDADKCKVLGQPIMYWGNKEVRGFRKQYSDIQKYIFTALVARSEVDFISLDKGLINSRKATDILIVTMEEYANFGFDYINDKMEDSPEYFFKNSSFLNLFLSFSLANENNDINIDEDVESLD